MYRAETWSLRVGEIHKQDVKEMKCIRSMFGGTRLGRWR